MLDGLRSPFSEIFKARRVSLGAPGDTTPPVISGTSFDDGTDTANFSTTEGGTLHWVIYLNSDGAPTLNTNGTWAGTTQETGSEAVPASGSGSLTPSYTTTTGDRLAYGIIDAEGNVSNVITETIALASPTTGYVSDVPYQVAAAATDIVIDLSGFVSGDGVFIPHQRWNGPQSTDNAPPGWTLVRDIESAGGGISFGLAVYHRTLDGTEDGSVTVASGSPNNGDHAAAAIGFRGLRTTGNPWNDLQSNVDNDTTFAGQGLADVTTVNASDIGVSFAAWGEDCPADDLAFSNPSAWTTDTIRRQFTTTSGTDACGVIATMEGGPTPGASDMGNIAPATGMAANAYRGSISLSLELA